MLSPDEAIAFTGHAVGGVCPFALPAGVPVYLDVSLKRFDVVYPAAGLINYFNGKNLVLINKSETPYDNLASLVINDAIGETLSQIKI